MRFSDEAHPDIRGDLDEEENQQQQQQQQSVRNHKNVSTSGAITEQLLSLIIRSGPNAAIVNAGTVNTEQGANAGLCCMAALVSWKEMKAVASLAGPLIMGNLLSFLLQLVSLAFVGHCGEIELSGAAIANSFAVVTGFSVVVGIFG
jgi:hypothetical protein